jgi:hypothetical protein
MTERDIRVGEDVALLKSVAGRAAGDVGRVVAVTPGATVVDFSGGGDATVVHDEIRVRPHLLGYVEE